MPVSAIPRRPKLDTDLFRRHPSESNTIRVVSDSNDSEDISEPLVDSDSLSGNWATIGERLALSSPMPEPDDQMPGRDDIPKTHARQDSTWSTATKVPLSAQDTYMTSPFLPRRSKSPIRPSVRATGSVASFDDGPYEPMKKAPIKQQKTGADEPSKFRQFLRENAVPMSGEFVGTFLFLLCAFTGTQVGLLSNDPLEPQATMTKPTPILINLYTSLCFGISLGANVWVFYRISGGLFNPAVTLAFMIAGSCGFVDGVLVSISQFAGAIAASGLVALLIPGNMSVGTTLQADTTPTQGLFLEACFTAVLTLTIFMLAVEKHRATYIAPIGIGMSFLCCELACVFFTGGGLNPARAFGPALIQGEWHPYHWIYWVGPYLGASVAALFYKALLATDYTTANPDQDSDGRHQVL